MKVLILNSGRGTRMGDYTKSHPKCMTKLNDSETIISRQLRILQSKNIEEVIITTGPFHELLCEYVRKLNYDLKITFVHNPSFQDTNYIYSIYLAKENIKDDILLLHGDLVFEEDVIDTILGEETSGIAVDWEQELPEKDFKAVIKNEKVISVGIEFMEDAVACQPLYFLKNNDWKTWEDEISLFCNQGEVNCYAEKALNNIAERIILKPVDVTGKICREIDNEEDLKKVQKLLKKL